jgi:hypothetical protein
MQPRYVGLAYLVAILGDVALSALANFHASLTTASYLYSALLTAFGTVVFMMAILGRLRPAAAFIVPAVLYAAVMVFGYVVGIAVAIKTRSSDQHVMSTAEVARVFPWWTTVNWMLIGITCLTGVACLVAFAVASNKPQETGAVAPVLPQ